MTYVEVYNIRKLKPNEYQEYHGSWVYDYDKQWRNRVREDIDTLSDLG